MFFSPPIQYVSSSQHSSLVRSYGTILSCAFPTLVRRRRVRRTVRCVSPVYPPSLSLPLLGSGAFLIFLSLLKVLKFCVFLVHVLSQLPIGQEEHMSLVLSLWELCRCTPLFPQFLPIYCKTSCPRHNVKLHNYASQLLRQHVARAYGQDTLYWL